MKLISKSIYAPDVQSDDALIDRMKRGVYTSKDMSDIVLARYRRGNLRMRVLECFAQVGKSKKIYDETIEAISNIDIEAAVITAIQAEFDQEQPATNVVDIGKSKKSKKKGNKHVLHAQDAAELEAHTA